MLRTYAGTLAAVRAASGNVECTDDVEHLLLKCRSVCFLCSIVTSLSNTHLIQLQAGHTLRHALQRIQRESSFCQNANRSSGAIASSFSTSSKRPSFAGFSSSQPSASSSYATCFPPLQALHLSRMTSSLFSSLSP